MSYLRAQPGDVGFTQGRGYLARAIRYATTSPGEAPSVVNHTLLFTSHGIVAPLEPGVAVPGSDQVRCVEALWHVEHHHWWKNHKKDVGSRIFVYRPLFLSEEAVDRVVHLALRHEGAKYGWWKLLFHLGDRALFDGNKRLSRLLRVDERPICSYLVGDSFAEAGWPEAFGEIKPEAQDPDDQYDYCDINRRHAHPASWEFVGAATVKEA